MTAKEFDNAIAALERRLLTLRDLRAGKLKMRRVLVKKHTVPEHTVSAHWRNIAALRAEPALKLLSGGRR